MPNISNMNVSLRQLRAFIAVAQERHFHQQVGEEHRAGEGERDAACPLETALRPGSTRDETDRCADGADQ